MFALAANAGLFAFLIVSLVVGVRLLLLAGRTRGFPELLIGTGFVVGGALVRVRLGSVGVAALLATVSAACRARTRRGDRNGVGIRAEPSPTRAQRHEARNQRRVEPRPLCIEPR
jgi:hypothetical protein